MYLFTAALGIAIALGSSPAQPPQYTSKSLKTASQAASTPAECNKLAAYFETRSAHFKDLAEQHARTLHRELERPSFGAKYPTAVDRARRMQEYYLDQATRAHTQSEHFHAMAIRETATAGTLSPAQP